MKKYKKVKKVLLIVIVLLTVLFGIFKVSDLIYQSKFPITYSEDIDTILSETSGWDCNETYGCEYQSDYFSISQTNDTFTLLSNDYNGQYSVYKYWYRSNGVTPITQTFSSETCSFNVLGFLECEEKTYRMTYNDQILLRKMKKVIDNALEDYIVN